MKLNKKIKDITIYFCKDRKENKDKVMLFNSIKNMAIKTKAIWNKFSSEVEKSTKIITKLSLTE